MRYFLPFFTLLLVVLLPLQAALADSDASMNAAGRAPADLTVTENTGNGDSERTDASADLLQVLLAIENLQGDFTQKQLSESGELLEQSSGGFKLLRPGFFRWEIKHPDSQLIVADPHYLWHHDLDLETVTRRPASASGQMAPLKILGGDYASLQDDYRISRIDEHRYRLIPNGSEAGFTALSLTVHNGTLSRMDVEDELGQTISIEFFSVDAETALTPDDFAFTPPADADLFYYDE